MGQEQIHSSAMFTPRFKARAPTGSGIWTPKYSTPSSSLSNLDEIQPALAYASPTPPPPPPPLPTQPIWTPQPSPSSGRKEFRPIHYQSPTLQRKYVLTQNKSETPPPWSSTVSDPCNLATTSSRSIPSTFSSNNLPDYCAGSADFVPTASVSDKIRTFERSASASELYRPFARHQQDNARPAYRPNEIRPHQYKTNGYQSEPEPCYESDYSVRSQPLDRRRQQSTINVSTNGNDSYSTYGTMPNPVKSGQNHYKNQPGRIENYVTGHSSVSDKEKKEWWDEVMDIFNGHLDQAKLSPHYTEGNLSKALAKESGYTSDSNLVFRRKEAPPGSALSPIEQRQAYKSLQAGGEPPHLGFRKTVPEKPKESPNRYFESDVNIHYRTPVRHEYKHPIPEEELAIRQAEQMQKLYQEERRRKYLQELQDMNSRRHTDNFTPSQKSPIALNRYDDFQSDLAPKSPSIYPKAAARALYNFQGQTARELSFKKGDIIYIRRKVDRNWYEGEHNAMIGLLPVNYIEILSRDNTKLPQRKPSEGQARAKFNFQAQSGVELSLNKGELVTLTRRVDENWFEGKIANRKGIFPVSYVEVLTDIGTGDFNTKTVITTEYSTTNLRPSLDTLRTNINNEFNSLTRNGILKETRSSPKTKELHVDTSSSPLAYRALYKYKPQNSDELELQEGDIVHVLEKCDDGWFVGTSQRTGYFGTFPGNYVERV